MDQEFDKDKILARVKKMMALANDKAATEGERDNALRMAHATLAKYNLSMAEATVHGDAPQDKRTDGAFQLREYAWMRSVAQAVGNLFFCSFFFVPTHAKHAIYCFVGKEANVYTAVEMVKYIIKSINNEGAKRASAIGETQRGTYWRDFCKGATIRIQVRCAELIRNAAQQTADQQTTDQKTPGTSLVLASVYQSEKQANEKYLEETVGKLKTRVSKQQRPKTAGVHEGYAYGGTLGLQHQIKGS